MTKYDMFLGGSLVPVVSGDDAAQADAGSDVIRVEQPPGTRAWELWANGFARFHALGAMAEGTLQAVDTGGTITADGQFVTLVGTSTAADKTGIILAKGSVNSVIKLFVNTSANLLTFAVAGTSFVADGANVAIAGGHMLLMYWSPAAQLWFAYGPFVAS